MIPENLLEYVLPTLFSAIFVIVYCGVFRLLKLGPRFPEIVIGILPVSAAAIILEPYLFGYVGAFVGLLVVAPIFEEILKFVGTARKRDASSGVGIGLGFAFVENLLYFHLFLAGIQIQAILSISFVFSQIFFFVVIRGAFDPLLHSTLSGLSTRTWQKGRRHWLPVAIAFHVAYNFVAIMGQSNLLFLVITDIAVLGPALYLLLRKTGTKDNMVTKDPVIAERLSAPPTKNTVDLGSMDLDEVVDYLRERSADDGFQGISEGIEIKSVEEYRKTRWIRRSLLVDGYGRRIRFTEVGFLGGGLIIGLAGLATVIVWVLFL